MREHRLDQEQLQTCGYGPCLVLGFRLIQVLNDLSEEHLIPPSYLRYILRTIALDDCTLYIRIYLLSTDWL